MYAISCTSPDGGTVYWVGGEVFSLNPEDASRFVKEVDAEATILVLTRAWPEVTDIYFVSELPAAAHSK